MKNSLENYVMNSGHEERTCYLLLIDAGIISDSCACLSEVAEADQEKAVEFLKGELF